MKKQLLKYRAGRKQYIYKNNDEKTEDKNQENHSIELSRIIQIEQAAKHYKMNIAKQKHSNPVKILMINETQ